MNIQQRWTVSDKEFKKKGNMFLITSDITKPYKSPEDAS